MTAAVDRFTKYLVMELEDDEDTTFVDDLLASAKTQILDGNGSVGFMTAGSIAGKNFSFNEKLSADEVAYACRMAKRIFNDDAGSGPITFPDFSNAFTS